MSKLRGGQSEMPPYVSLHDVETWELPVYAGKAHAPFRVFSRGPKYKEPMDNLRLATGMTRQRLADARRCSAPLTPSAATSTPHGPSRASTPSRPRPWRSSFRGRCATPSTWARSRTSCRSPTARSRCAFDFVPGTLFLQARRLVEAGVSVVGINLPGWDTHVDNFKVMRQQLPVVDQALCALLTDLHDRGLDKDVTILMAGEMGRDPRISKDKAGREHWPQAGIAVMAGGGLKMGQVVGASDAHGAEVKGRAITPQMMLATLYHTMGIDPATTIPDHNGRPMYLLDERDKIEELV